MMCVLILVLSQAYMRVALAESEASKMAERDKLMRLLPRERMYQVCECKVLCCDRDRRRHCVVRLFKCKTETI